MSNFIVYAPERFIDIHHAREWWTRCCMDWQDFERVAFWYRGRGITLNRTGTLGEIDAQERRIARRILQVRGWTLELVEEVALWASTQQFGLWRHVPPAGYGCKTVKRGEAPPAWDPPPGIGRAIPEPLPCDDVVARERVAVILDMLAVIG